MADRLEGNETGCVRLRQVANNVTSQKQKVLVSGETEDTSGEDVEVAGRLPSINVQYEKRRKNERPVWPAQSFLQRVGLCGGPVCSSEFSQGGTIISRKG